MTPKPKRPRRMKKADRLLHGEMRKAEIECDYGIAPLDRLASVMDLKWGVDRLPDLVTPELSAKYGKAMAYLNECIAAQDPAKCAGAAANCIKGLRAMDAMAEANGAEQATGLFWEYELETETGEPFRFGVLIDKDQWQTAKARRPDLTFYSMREVAVALHERMNTPLIAETKKHFPGSEVRSIKTQPPCDYDNGGDRIPF